MLLRDVLPGLQMLPEAEDRIFANSREGLGKGGFVRTKDSYHLLRLEGFRAYGVSLHVGV